MATASIGALTINAATDFSLYLAMSYQNTLQSGSTDTALRAALGQQGEVVIADCLLNTICFLPLLASSFSPVRELGWMMGVMLLACAVGALIGMALLLPWCVMKSRNAEVLVSEPARVVSWARTL
jgi:predicted RND superfamily exporter protein